MKSIYIFTFLFVGLITGAQDKHAFFGNGTVNSSSTLKYGLPSVYPKTTCALPDIFYSDFKAQAPDNSFLSEAVNSTFTNAFNIGDKECEFTNAETNLPAKDSEIYGHYSVAIGKLRTYTVFLAKSFPIINRSAVALLGFESDPLETNSSTGKPEGNLPTNEKSIPAVTGNYSNPNKY